MRDASTFIASQRELFTAPAVRPMAPWDYMRLRREDAGLSIERVARFFWHRDEHRADVEAQCRMSETHGVRLRNVRWFDIPRAFPFDPEIYRTLAELPPEQHPALCRGCGWDQWTVQADLDGFDRTWSEEMPGLCTRCEQIETRGLRRRAA